MRNKLWKAGLVAFGMAFLVPSVAPAGMISMFHDPYHQTAPSLFVDAANAPLTVEGFTNSFHKPIPYVLNTNTNYSPNQGGPIRPGDIQPGATYSSPDPGRHAFYFDFMNISAGAGYTGGFLQGVRMAPLTVTFDDPTSAFGFFSNTDYGSLDVRINFTSGQFYDATYGQFAMYQGFLGFVSDSVDIASVVLSPPDQGGDFSHISLDNFTFATTASSAVPEPGSAFLLVCGGMGLIGIRAARRR